MKAQTDLAPCLTRRDMIVKIEISRSLSSFFVAPKVAITLSLVGF